MRKPTPEPFPSPDAPAGIRFPLLTQQWLDLTFIHWAVEPAVVAGLLPPGTRPDTHQGVTYAGLVAFRMHKVSWFGLPGVPYLGSFPETNVRLYSVDTHGRRGVVFLSMDASRLIPVALGRIAFRLPYRWSRMSARTTGDIVDYTSARRRPRAAGAYSRITVRRGQLIENPTELEQFLTARWGMHNPFLGGASYLPNHHPRWPLHRAELITCEENLLTAAGLPAPRTDPVSVLYSPGVSVRLGRPVRRTSALPATSPGRSSGHGRPR